MDSSSDRQMTKTGRVLVLRVTAGRDEGRIFPLAEGFIGSRASCEIHLSDPGISAIHARITFRKDSWNITDLTSAPDLRVNNSIVKSRKIQYGDTISLGGTTFQIVDVPPETESPNIIETKKAASERKDAPPSQTMQISIEGNVQDWKPGKPKPKEAETVVAQDEPQKSTNRRLKPSPSRHSASPYRSRMYSSDQSVENSGSRAMVYVLLIVAVIAPLLIGGIYLANKKQERSDLAMAYQAAQDFEIKNASSFRESVELYRKVQMLAAGSNPNLAMAAEENIMRLEAVEQKQTKDLADTLADLDKRAEILTAEGDFQRAIGVYENYIGRFADKVVEARKAEILNLQALSRSNTASPALLDTASIPAERVSNSPALPASTSQSGENPGFNMNEYISAAADALIAGDLELAESELKKTFSATAEPNHHLTAKQALLMLQPFRTVAENIRNAKEGAAASDPSEDQSQPAIIRLVYYLRKNDLFAAQVIAGKLDDSPLSRELASRGRMSADQLRIEKDVIAEFAKIWISFEGKTVGNIPRPSDCMKVIIDDKGRATPADIAKLCQAMIQLQVNNSNSQFIARYSEFFDACKNRCTQLTEKSAKYAGAGNGVIIDVDGNSCFFETTDPLPASETAKVGLIRENRVFYAPGTTSRTATIVEIITALPFKKISAAQGLFDIPAVFTFKRPEKNDRILVCTGLKEKIMVIPLQSKVNSSMIYEADFTKPLGKEWSAFGGSLAAADGVLNMDMTKAKHRSPAGMPDFQFNQKIGSSPLDIRFTMTLNENSDLVLTLGAVEFVLTSKPGRPAGTFFEGRRTSTVNSSPVKSGVPLDVDIYWTPHYATLKVANHLFTAPVDSRSASASLNRVGFAVSGKLSLRSFSIAKAEAAGANIVIGASGDKSSVLIQKLPAKEWQELQPGHTIFVSNLAAETAKTKMPETITTKAVITTVFEEHIVAKIDEPAKFTGRKVTASLTDRIQSPSDPQPKAPQFLPADGWMPQSFLGHIATNNGQRIIIPDISSSFGPQGYLGIVSGIVTNHYTREPFAAFVASTKPGAFSESAGMLKCEALNEIPVSAGKGPVILTAAQSSGQNMIPLTPLCLSMNPMLFPQPSGGWNEISGGWTRKLNRLISPRISGPPAVIETQRPLWENCQYMIDIKIEAASTSTNRSELIIELFSPLWQRAVSLETGSKGTSINADLIASALGQGGPKSAIFDSKFGIVLNKEKRFTRSAPILAINKNYQIMIRRAADTFAFYIDGQRLATLLYPGMKGDLLLRIASINGQTSIGPATGTLLSRSVRITPQEPDLGEFGYIVAVEGASVMFDTDAFSLSKGDTISVMKIDKVIAGEASKTFLLKRAALGKVTDLNSRTAVAVTSSLTEPIQSGMKIMPGQQPETLTLSSDLLSVKE